MRGKRNGGSGVRKQGEQEKEVEEDTGLMCWREDGAQLGAKSVLIGIEMLK